MARYSHPLSTERGSIAKSLSAEKKREELLSRELHVSLCERSVREHPFALEPYGRKGDTVLTDLAKQCGEWALVWIANRYGHETALEVARAKTVAEMIELAPRVNLDDVWYKFTRTGVEKTEYKEMLRELWKAAEA